MKSNALSISRLQSLAIAQYPGRGQRPYKRDAETRDHFESIAILNGDKLLNLRRKGKLAGVPEPGQRGRAQDPVA